jgi:ethanolamine ammonia-lyase small subunit
MSAKTSVLTATLLALMTAHATAQDCSGTPVATDAAALTSFLNSKLICAYKPDSGGTDPNQRWSETHASGVTV